MQPLVEVEVPVRRSYRLEERKLNSLGHFRSLPCELVQLVLSFLPGRAIPFARVLGSNTSFLNGS